MPTTYKIQAGDNLSTIAKKNRTTVQDILKLNPDVKNPDLIYTGSSLVLPDSQTGQITKPKNYLFQTPSPTPSAPSPTPPAPTSVGKESGALSSVPAFTPSVPAQSGISSIVNERAGITEDPRDQLISQLTAAITKSTSFDPVARKAELEKERGVGGLREAVGTFSDEVAKTNQLLDQLEEDINKRTEPFLVGEEARRRVYASEQAPILKTLGIAERGYEATKAQLSEEEKNILAQLGIEETAAGADLKNLGTSADILSKIKDLTAPEKPINVEGQLVQFNPDTGGYEVVFGNKKIATTVTEVGGHRVLINDDTGDVIRDLGPVKAGAGEGGLSDLGAAILANPALYNTLTPSAAQAIIPELSALGFKFPRKLTGEQAKSQQNALSGLDALSNLETEVFDANGTLNVSNLLLSKSGYGSLATAAREVSDVITRLRTGAALNTYELNFYPKQIPRVGDTAEIAQKKLDALKVFFAGMAGSTITLQSPEGEQYAYENMFDPDVRKEVRDAMEAGYSIADY